MDRDRKYYRLYAHLCGLRAQGWRTTFEEIEAVLGFELPPSARLYPAWWSNQSIGHSQTLAWSAAGWETAEVDMGAETLLFRPRARPAADRYQKYREMAARGKYRRLYAHLCGLRAQEWRTTFEEIEAVLGFELPASARLHRPWWSNESRAGSGHSHSLAWSAAGWETAEVDMDAETLLFRPRERPAAVRTPTLDAVWPVHSAGRWPEDLSLTREYL